MLGITKHYKIWFAFSGAMIIVSIVFLFLWGLKPGIDFRGGALLEAKFEGAVQQEQVKQTMADIGFGDSIVQKVNDNTVLIKMRPLSEQDAYSVKENLTSKIGAFEEQRFDSIGPTIGKELVSRAYWQIFLVAMGIIFYIAYAFRKIKNFSKEVKLSSWRLGFATIVALLHDLIITVGFFALLNKLFGAEVDTLFVTALLTILGFSVHDTIVVFDRIREYLKKYEYESFTSVIDFSINSTMARSINTTSTLIFVLIAMLFFGGETIHYFILALLIGVTAGTYSSIFLASPILALTSRAK